ncbi:MAG: type VI secretion system tube protein Hcp [Isosphaeraceae bacterium]|nr:type VI secretion system tube protein Hcp [Isosphaeraceae bacterium]
MAQFDAYLKLGDIKGESQKEGHKDEIELQSVSLGAVQAGTAQHGTGLGSGKVALQDIHCTALVDKATPFLFLYCCNGKHISDGTITLCKAGGKQEKFLEVTLKDVLISSFKIAGSQQGDVVPTCQFGLNFVEMSIEYFAQDSSGKTTSAGKKTFNAGTLKAS